MSRIGEKIKQVRIDKGMTQDELAIISGISKTAICRYELGQREPRIAQMEAIADALEIPIEELLDLSSDSRKKFSYMSKVAERAREKILAAELEAVPPEVLEGYKQIHELSQEMQTEYISEALDDSRIQVDKRKKRMEKTLLDAFNQLSDKGQKIAIERIRELGKIPEYKL